MPFVDSEPFQIDNAQGFHDRLGSGVIVELETGELRDGTSEKEVDELVVRGTVMGEGPPAIFLAFDNEHLRGIDRS